MAHVLILVFGFSLCFIAGWARMQPLLLAPSVALVSLGMTLFLHGFESGAFALHRLAERWLYSAGDIVLPFVLVALIAVGVVAIGDAVGRRTRP